MPQLPIGTKCTVTAHLTNHGFKTGQHIWYIGSQCFIGADEKMWLLERGEWEVCELVDWEAIEQQWDRLCHSMETNCEDTFHWFKHQVEKQINDKK